MDTIFWLSPPIESCNWIDFISVAYASWYHWNCGRTQRKAAAINQFACPSYSDYLVSSDTAPPWSALASISRSDWLQAGGAGLQMPPWTGAELPRRRIQACVGDWVGTESSVGFEGQSCRASLSAEDTRQSWIPCGSGSSMEQPTVTSSSSMASFKRNLKTELFLRSYVQPWYRLMLHVTFLTLLRALEVNIDLRHVNHIRYYYYYYYYWQNLWEHWQNIWEHWPNIWEPTDRNFTIAANALPNSRSNR